MERVGLQSVKCFFLGSVFWAVASSCSPAPEPLFVKIKTDSRQGKFLQAKAEAEKAFERYRDKPEILWSWQFRFLYANLLLVNGETQKAQSLLIPPPFRYSQLSAEYQRLLGYVEFRFGHDRQASTFTALAAKNAHAANDFEVEAESNLLLGLYTKDQAQAQQLLDNTVLLATEHGLSFQLAAAYLNLGSLRLDQSRYGEAIAYFQQSETKAKLAGASVLRSIALGDLAACYFRLGDYPKSYDLRLSAIELQAQAGLATPLRDSYLGLGNAYLAQGDAEHALVYLRKALSLVNAKDSPVPFSRIACQIAAALEKAGSLAESESYNRQALEALPSTEQAGRAGVALNSAAIVAHRGEYQKAIEHYQEAISLSQGTPALLWASYGGLASVFQKTGQIPEAEALYEKALRVVDENRSDQLQSGYKITFLSQVIELYQDYVELLVSQNKELKALQVADSSRASVLTQDLMPNRNSGASARAVQEMAKQSGRVFLFYWLAPKHSYLWAIVPNGTHMFVLPAEREISQQVRSYRNAVEKEKQDPLTASTHLAEKLYETLLSPARNLIAPGANVVIIPDGALHALNFETLIVAKPVKHFLIEDVTVSVAPSLSVLSVKDTDRQRGSPSLLLVGDPTTAGTGFERLAYAQNEMEQILGNFPVAQTLVYRGADASAASYLQAPVGQFETIHFVAHAEANEQSPLDSAIILSPRNNAFRLYARDIMADKLKANLVTISACRGANAQTLSGEGPVGLAWAFFQAGARNVVASLWDVNDRTTADLMGRFYAGIEKGSSYEDSLRAAKLALLHSAHPKPYYWAPFQLYTRIIAIQLPRRKVLAQVSVSANQPKVRY